ncbi:J domain-containing protein [Thermobrachium celere]|uniref:J domain-containing protein n=1 Tax=Thermobrachium celere TaxID=53422 RepID=UPI00194447B1|nr:DnaJ domain-containing protein [Thermobrachium celere]GFR35515.1 molecular chaperone DnaJ [Thermobrachium celere]
MKNPYEVLGVDKNASMEDIKRAYRELVKKYHPDRYHDNPLKELAEEKLREINEAYEYLLNNHEKQQGGYSSSYSSGGYYGQNSFSDFQRVREYINRGDYFSAERELNRINIRNDEWFYLMGLIYINRGNYSVGYDYIKRASEMNPYNQEYRDALYRMNNSYRSYNTHYYNTPRRSNDDCCTICTYLYCADCCCECLGGDLISCC